jgi:hypothetical protein
MDSREWRRERAEEGLLKEPVLSSEAAQAAEAEAEIREAWRTWILADSRTGLLVRRMKEMLAEATSVMDETASESLWRKAQGGKAAIVELLDWIGSQAGFEFKDGGFKNE